MRILFLTDRFSPQPLGGAERSALSISTFLARRGHEITVVTRRFSEDLSAEEYIGGLRVLRYTPRPVPDRLWMFSNTIACRGAIPVLRNCQGQYDVAVAYPPYVRQLARLAPSIRRVYRAGGTMRGAQRWEQRQFQNHSLRMRLWNALKWKQLFHDELGSIRKAEQIVTPSRNIKDQLLHYYGLRDEQVTVIHNGVDVNWLVPCRRPDPNHTFRIVSVGRLDSVKNHRLLLAAISVAKHRPKIRLRLVGDGSLREALGRQVRQLGLADLVEMVGHDDNVKPHYQWGDLFVLPSIYEGIGSAMLEAMSCALPCVALRQRPPEIWTASEEIIEDGGTGRLFEENTPQCLAKTLDSLCEAPSLCRQMGQAGRRRAERLFTWDRAAQQYEELLEQLVKTRRNV